MATSAKRKPLPPSVAAEWAQLAHVLYLEALMIESNWSCNQLAFHGGTSLHLSWRSQRYSEDLDFLLARQVTDLAAVAKRVERALRERFMRRDPGFVVEVRDKSKDADRLAVFHIVVSHPQYIGNVMAKAEFWRVAESYLAKYPVELRTPSPTGLGLDSLLTTPIPAATLQAAFADKLTAFATRPHLKWRDIFDLWWIGTQTRTPLDMPDVVEQFLHNVSAYQTRDLLKPAEALRLFLVDERDAMVAKADPDLKRWLPEPLWRQLDRMGGVAQMVDYVRFAIASVADAVDVREAARAKSAASDGAPSAGAVEDEDLDALGEIYSVDLKSLPHERPRGG